LSSPGLTGRPSIPEAFAINREAAAYWIARSSRATTGVVLARYLRRHCEERSDEAIQLAIMDCFAEPVIGRAFARPVGSQ
jgi:hypothetical protein